MKKLEGSITEANLKAIITAESEAKSRYSYYAFIAEREGHEKISKFLLEMSQNELENVITLFKLIKDTGSAAFDTFSLLKDSIYQENQKWTKQYSQMAAEAENEGFTEIAHAFNELLDLAKQHERICLELIEGIKDKPEIPKE
ncbi:MAG: hypothetical protein LBQ61_00465 [Spirochaetales bacterium]|jgi:rubrerythrin|nr:hypothetical protein [Spirochaetales bacterium]